MKPLLAGVLAALAAPAWAAPDWNKVDAALGRPGTEQAGGVHRYGFPLSDLHVTLDGVAIKPAREAKAGETVSARTVDITRVYKVLGFPPRRISAPEVAAFAEDLTPPEAREEARQKTLEPGFRARGLGRPTKRERRQIDRWDDPM